MVELVDTLASKTSVERRIGSSPVRATNPTLAKEKNILKETNSKFINYAMGTPAKWPCRFESCYCDNWTTISNRSMVELVNTAFSKKKCFLSNASME